MKHRTAHAFGRGKVIHGKRAVAGATTPTVLLVEATPTQNSITVTWAVSEPATGQVQWGSAIGSYPNSTTKETSFDYDQHVQTITGLSAGSVYHLRVVGENEAGFGYASNDVAVSTLSDPSGTINYTDYSLVGITSYAGHPIDVNGVVDSAAGINAWIAAQPNGTDEGNHARYIFPPTARYRLDGGPICVGNKSHVTLWGHAATSSAWIRGDATSYQDPGCTIDRADIPLGPHGSAFILGATLSGYNVLSWNKPNLDVIVRGFDIVCPDNPFPGTMCHYWSAPPYDGRGAHQSNNSFELEYGNREQVCYNRSEGMAGDFVRFRYSMNSWVHHNYCVDTGRMAVTAVINIPGQDRSDNLVEDCTFDRSGYWHIDLEPEDESNTALRQYDGLVVRDCLFGTSGDGGFCVIGGTDTPGDRHIADVEIADNTIDGSGYGDFPYNTRSLRSLIAHIADLSSVPVGQDPRPQNVTFSRNVVTHGETYPGSSVLTARGTDGLTIHDNDANYAGSDWASTLYCTNVNESGNT